MPDHCTQTRSLKFITLSLLVGLFAFLFNVLSPASSTLAASCYEKYPETITYGGQTTTQDDTYDVYVKLPKRGQQANVQVYQEFFDSASNQQCTASKKVKASGDSWTKAATWNVQDGTVAGYLTGEGLPDEYGANRPMLLLVSTKNPICNPKDECAVLVEDQPGTIVPMVGATDENGLIITVPHAVEGDVLKNVSYYVDDTLMYTTPTLEEFDMRYVSFPKQRLTRLLQYESGQQVVLESVSPDNFTDSFGNFIFRLAYLNPTGTKLFALISILLLLLATCLFIARLVVRRRDWRIHHGFITPKTSSRALSSQDVESNYKRSQYILYAKRGLTYVVAFVTVCLCIVLTTRYIATINQVNGVSMENTLKDKTWLAVNRLPITWGKITNKQYTPSRGDIITVNEVYGHQSTADAAKEHRQLVKRVLALPGERITINNGNVRVFNDTHPDGFNPDSNASWKNTMISDLSGGESLDITLLSNEFFVAGDNRLASVDSRMNGPIAISNIEGVLIAPLPF